MRGRARQQTARVKKTATAQVTRAITAGELRAVCDYRETFVCDEILHTSRLCMRWEVLVRAAGRDCQLVGLI